MIEGLCRVLRVLCGTFLYGVPAPFVSLARKRGRLSKPYVLFVGQIITHKVHKLMNSPKERLFINEEWWLDEKS